MMKNRYNEVMMTIQPQNPRTDLETIERTEERTEKPSLWNVVMLNDDFTPMEFVVMVLMRVFHKSHEEAESIMFQVHVDGKGIAGTYTHEVAETKADETMKLARSREFPLKCELQQA